MFEWPSRVGVLRFLDILYTTNQSHGAHTTLQLLNMVAQCNGALLRDWPGWSEVGCRLHHHQLAGWRAILCISFSEVSHLSLIFQHSGWHMLDPNESIYRGGWVRQLESGFSLEDCPSAPREGAALAHQVLILKCHRVFIAWPRRFAALWL